MLKIMLNNELKYYEEIINENWSYLLDLCNYKSLIVLQKNILNKF
jgi:hypothetical protein